MHRALRNVSFRRLPLPDNLVHEPLSSEYFIENCFRIKANVPIEVDVDRSVLMKQLMQKDDGFVEPF
jgi:hypothetical protein